MTAQESDVIIARASRRRVRLLAAGVALAVAATLVNLPERYAEAAPGQLTEVTGFGSNPGNLQMFEWIPTDLPANAPLVVMLHGCFSKASSYDTETGLTMVADRLNVALVFPGQQLTNNQTSCFNAWQPGDNTRGQGEALSVMQMVEWMHANRGTDPDRVYIMGHSGGGFFTSVMLATYPDVFKAGAIVAGAPYKCGADMTQCGGAANASNTPQQWGDLARSGFPGYSGPKPRVSIWHGSSDSAVSPANLTELVEQWTNYHGIDQTADVDETINGHPHKIYQNAAGTALVESYSVIDGGHGWPIDPGAGPDQCDGATPPSADYDICTAYYVLDNFMRQGGDDSPAITTITGFRTKTRKVNPSWVIKDSVTVVPGPNRTVLLQYRKCAPAKRSCSWRTYDTLVTNSHNTVKLTYRAKGKKSWWRVTAAETPGASAATSEVRRLIKR